MREKISSHRNIYFFLLITLAVSLPLSIFTTTIAEIFLLVNWIWESNFMQKWNTLKLRKGAILITGIYFIHLAGLIYTTDFNYGLHELKIKLPILILPIIIATSSPLNQKELRIILLLFSASVLAGTFVSAGIFFGFTNYPLLDFRDISPFISHIRMALMVVFTIFILIYYLTFSGFNSRLLFLFIPAILWLVFFLVMLKSLTGIILLSIAGFIVALKYSGKIKEVAPRFIVRTLIITLPLIPASWLAHTADKYLKRDKIDMSALEKFTPAGNEYYHDTSENSVENGNYVYLYISEKELKEEWNKVSDLSYDGRDRKGQELRFTLMRYLTSKGFRKDANGVNKLSVTDIESIENGMANYIFLDKFSLYPRIYEVLWELDSYSRGNDVGGHSIAQRIIYLKAASNIIKENPVTGVGTGDIKNEFDTWYRKSISLADEKWWLRAHNQYMSFIVAFGIPAFILIMIFLFLPPFLGKKWGDYFFLCFAIIGFTSMLTEDTLETQTGVSFFMFFYSLLLFGGEEKFK